MEEKSNMEIVHTIIDQMNASTDLISFVKDRKGHDFRYAVNADKIKQLGWKPEISFEDGMKETIKWYKNNQNYWTGV
jgi:dTDP-glucose 4,6-dehydratase